MSVPDYGCFAGAAGGRREGRVDRLQARSGAHRSCSLKLCTHLAQDQRKLKEEVWPRPTVPCQQVTWDLPPPAGVSEPSLHLPNPTGSLADGNLEQARRESGEHRPLSPGDPGQLWLRSHLAEPSYSQEQTPVPCPWLLSLSRLFHSSRRGVLHQPAPSPLSSPFCS